MTMSPNICLAVRGRLNFSTIRKNNHLLILPEGLSSRIDLVAIGGKNATLLALLMEGIRVLEGRYKNFGSLPVHAPVEITSDGFESQPHTIGIREEDSSPLHIIGRLPDRMKTRKISFFVPQSIEAKIDGLLSQDGNRNAAYIVLISLGLQSYVANKEISVINATDLRTESDLISTPSLTGVQ